MSKFFLLFLTIAIFIIVFSVLLFVEIPPPSKIVKEDYSLEIK